MADPNKWRAKIKELQNELVSAQKAGDSVRVKKLKEDLRRVASVPFDSKIKQIENQRPVSNQDRLPDAPVDRNAVRQDLLKKEQQELNKAQGLDSEKPEDKFGGGPAVNALKTPAAAQNKGNEPAKTPSADQPFDKAEQKKAGAKGGPEASGPANRDDSESDGGDEGPQKGPNIRNAIANKAIDYAKKAALQAAKKVAVFFAANPYAWVVLGIILLIQIAVFAAAMSFLGNKNVNTLTGGTFTQAADPIEHKDWITKVLALAGNKEIGEKIAIQFAGGLRSDLTQLKNDAKDNPDLTAKIQKAIDDLNNVVSSKSQADAEKLIADLKEILEKYENGLFPKYPIGSQPPLEKITESSFSDSLHGGSYLRHEPIKGHGIYMQFNQKTCDAVDIDGKADTEVKAMFSGKVVPFPIDGEPPQSDGHEASMVVIQDERGYKAVYAHLKNIGSAPIGKEIKAGDKIGEINKNHLHLEVAYKGKCIVTTVADKMNRHSSVKKHQNIGAYLWDNIKSKMNIPS